MPETEVLPFMVLTFTDGGVEELINPLTGIGEAIVTMPLMPNPLIR